MENNKHFKEILIDLSNGLDQFIQSSFSMKKFWYWEYYESVRRDIEDNEERRRIYKQIYHMEKFGYFDRRGFSAKGLGRVLKARFNKKRLEEKWDKKWRIVIFDIPEKLRNKRDCFRDSLKCAGFQKLQNSIWVNPLGEFDDIQELARHYKIEKYVILIFADNISNDLLLKQKFKL